MAEKYSREQIFTELSGILESEFEIDKSLIKEDADLFADLDLDSIDLVDLAVRMQKYTDKRLTPEEFKQIRTLKDAVNTLYSMMQSCK